MARQLLDRRLLRGLILLLALLPAALWLRLARAEAARPNVIVIQTDDQSSSTLRARFRDPSGRIRQAMPHTLGLIAGQGTEFTRYYATQPVCGPSRAALLTGQYAHNSGLKRNSGPSGGWTGWQQLPLLNDNLAVTLQGAGYRTIHVGKFTNNYVTASGEPEPVVPPGWDSWNTMSYGRTLLYYGYFLNRDGAIDGPLGDPGYDLVRSETDPVTCTAARLLEPDPFGECVQGADKYSRIAVNRIRAAGDRPFYLQLDYNTPHNDSRSPAGPEPASRHYDTAFGSRMPRPPGFNEPDIRDKPRWLREIAPRMERPEIARIDARWGKELEALRDVDDGVAAIVRTLRQTGKLRNTYLIFLSDNGLFHGEHRFSGAKFLAYEPSARVPMMIRGPGVPPGRRTAELSGNIDIAPTVLDLAGIGGRTRLDGRSLRPFWEHPDRRSGRPLFIESWIGAGGIDDEESTTPAAGLPDATVSVLAPALSYRAIRVGSFKYVEYRSGERELYDLARDPAELDNRINAPGYHRLELRLAEILKRRKDCEGADCRQPVGSLPAPAGGG